MQNASNSRAIAYRDVGNEREQGCGSVTGISRLDFDHFESQLDSPRLMQRFPNTLCIMPISERVLVIDCISPTRFDTRPTIILSVHTRRSCGTDGK